MANEEQLRILRQGVDAWNQWREDYPNERVDLTDADLTQANLTQANLTRADLFDAHLTDAHLTDANLTQAHLFEADFTRANLTDANLTRAGLTRAILSGVHLFRADLTQANLLGADLLGADLTGADLTGAEVGGTVLGNTNLTDVKGLDICRHEFPSTIDHRTLAKSGRLPLAFLRGCSLPDFFIDHVPSLFLDNPIEFYSCFISYSTADHDFAERLHADLQDKGVRCWFAPEDMKIGDPVRLTVDTAIRLRDKLVLILSDTSIASDWVEHEVSQALQEEERRGTPILFPLRIDEAVMQVEFGWAKRLREAHAPTGRHIGDFTHWKDHDAYQRAFARLLRDLKPDNATNPL